MWAPGSFIEAAKPASSCLVALDRVVCRIEGNNCRLVVHLVYRHGVVYVRFERTHAQYDRIKGDLTCRGYSQSAPSETTARH